MPQVAGKLLVPSALVAAGLLLTLPAAADGQPPDQAIDQIVVVAHKIERSIRDVAANVTVVDRDALDEQLALSLGDVFRYVPGVDHESGGTRFGDEGISLRGIGGNRVAILVDGVPLSDQFDVGSFSNATRDFLDAGLIENIEVLHGPASALYGSAAIGGVVAVTTPDPQDITHPEVRFSWREADDSLAARALTSFDSGGTGLVLGASWREGGERDAAAAAELDMRDSERTTALAKLVYDNQLGHTLRAGFIHQRAHTLTDLRTLLGSGRYRSTTALRGDDLYESGVLNLSYEFGEDGGFIDDGLIRAFYQQTAIEQSTLDERANARTPVSIDRFFSFEQDSLGFDVNVWKTLDSGRASHRLAIGAEYRERDFAEYRDGVSTDLSSGAQTRVLLGEAFPLRDFPLSKTRELALFIEDSATYGGDWTLIAAVRADRFELTPRIDAMYAEDYPFAQPVAIDESDISPKLGLVFRVSPGIDAYVQYAHGFRAPPYADANVSLEIPFFNYRAIPNPELRSESSDGIDVGLRWQGTSSRAQISLFHTRYEDFIESKVRLGPDPVSGRTLFQSQNLESTVIEGLEASGSVGFGGRFESLTLRAGAYYARGEDRASGEALNSVGPPEATLELRWDAPHGRRDLQLRMTARAAWDDRNESRGELFKPAGHAVLDLFLTERLSERTTLRVGLLNLTDRTYWHWADVRGLSPDDPMLPSLSRAGLSATLAIQLQL